MRTVQQLDPSQLAGSVVAVPVVNTPMFQRRSGFLSPIDGLNLNRTAPGLAEGTISERLAHVLLREVIGACQYHIDCHGGDLGEILWPYAGYALTGDAERDRQGEELARLWSPGVVALYREGSALPPTSGSLTFQASWPKPAATARSIPRTPRSICVVSRMSCAPWAWSPARRRRPVRG
jgi:predicted deacylase